MFNHRHYQAIAVGIGLALMALVGTGHAYGAEVPAKSKALAHYIVAVVNDLNGDTQAAMGEYQKSVKLDQHQPLPHLRLGAYYARLGRLEEAVSQLKTAIKLQPNASQSHYLLALIYSSQKKYDSAAGEYEAILKLASDNNPTNVDIHAYLAQLYYALHKNLQALQELNQILQFQPKNVSALYLLGSVYLDLNEREKSKAEFRKILALEPDHDGALNSLAYMYAEDGVNLDEALKMARRAIELDPSSGAYYDTLGWVLFKQGFNAESLMALEKAQTYMADAIIYDHMGDVYKAVNEPALARKFWLKSLMVNSQQSQVSAKIEQLNKTSARVENINYNPSK